MSCRVQWHSLPSLPSWALQMCPLCGLYTPFYCSWALIAVGMSVATVYPRKISYKDWLWPPWRISCAGAYPTEQDISRTQVPTESALCVTCGGGSGESQEMQTKASGHLCSAQGHPTWAIKQFADSCCLRWAWRCPGDVKLLTQVAVTGAT